MVLVIKVIEYTILLSEEKTWYVSTEIRVFELTNCPVINMPNYIMKFLFTSKAILAVYYLT